MCVCASVCVHVHVRACVCALIFKDMIANRYLSPSKMLVVTGNKQRVILLPNFLDVPVFESVNRDTAT